VFEGFLTDFLGRARVALKRHPAPVTGPNMPNREMTWRESSHSDALLF